MPSRASTARAQSAYYVTSGVWPLVSPRTFQAVTGPKDDVWLVQTVGALIAVIGATLGTAAGNEEVRDTRTVRTLAVGSAISLAAVDLVFVARRRISPIYLADAAAELALAAAWLLPLRSRRAAAPASRDATASARS